MLFGEKFKRASKNITVSVKVLDDTRNKMMLAAVPVKNKKCFVKATLSFVAIVVVVCVSMLGTQVFNPPYQPKVQQAKKSLFSISAYAYEQQENGQLTQKEINLSQEEAYTSETIITIRGGENDEYQVTQIKMLGFKCQGENIAKVDFQIDNGELKVPNENWSKDKRLQNLEPRGKKLSVDYEAGTPDEVYWESEPYLIKVDADAATKPYNKKIEIKDSMLIPEMSATITATVYFKNGSKAQKSLVYNNEKGTIKVEETN